MPPLKSVQIDLDSVTITSSHSVTGGDHVLTRAAIPSHILNRSIAEVEDWVNTWLSNHYSTLECYVQVHIFEISPKLKWNFICSEEPIVDEGNWWE